MFIQNLTDIPLGKACFFTEHYQSLGEGALRLWLPDGTIVAGDFPEHVLTP